MADIVTPVRVYAAVTLLSAFLLFLVQPLIAKAILPWFGGAPSVWTTCLLFFQSALLAGYAYSHFTRPLKTQRQVAVHLALLVLTLLALPIIPAESWKPAGNESPVWRIIGLLTVTVGAPYLMLATTAPLLQDWFRREATDTPYRLYAWSNAGSLIALVGYPFAFERWFSVPDQARLWSAVYAVFVAGVAVVGWRVVRLGPAADQGASRADDAAVASPSRADRTLWFGFSACASGLLMAITNQLTLDVASVPFLWVVPLALYLVTFIIAFSGRYTRQLWRPGLIVSLGIMAALHKMGASVPLTVQVAGSTFALFAGCMVCNGEMVLRSPGPKYLTSFYLTMAAGGAAGGIFVGLIAPVIFPDFWELPIFLLLPYFLMVGSAGRETGGPPRAVTWAATLGVLFVGIAFFVVPAVRGSDSTVASSRNFYGVLRVLDDKGDTLHPLRYLWHGRITHGTQLLRESERSITTAYYADGSGVAHVLNHHPKRALGQPLNIGAIGLGVGTIAAYGQPGDSLRFFEINADVERMARDYFTFLSDSKATVDVAIGDGRLTLEREVARPGGEHRYDVIIADAFSGDAVPIHLLTEEAMALYWRALREDGILAVHISNRYLNLAPVVTALAPTVRKRVVRIRRPGGGAAYASTWILMSSNTPFLRYLINNVPYGADIPAEPPVVWTDAFSNLYQVFGKVP